MSDTDQQDQTDQREADDQGQHREDTHESDLGDAGKAALKREREARKSAEKARADLERRLAEFEQQQKARDDEEAKKRGEWEKVATEREKELEELRAAIAERDLNDLKRAVAADEGLPAELAMRLTGDDEDALRKDAKALAKHLKAKEATETDAGDRTKPGQKRPDKGEFANPARWGLRT